MHVVEGMSSCLTHFVSQVDMDQDKDLQTLKS